MPAERAWRRYEGPGGEQGRQVRAVKEGGVQDLVNEG
jgi:hypothetical protein